MTQVHKTQLGAGPSAGAAPQNPPVWVSRDRLSLKSSPCTFLNAVVAARIEQNSRQRSNEQHWLRALRPAREGHLARCTALRQYRGVLCRRARVVCESAPPPLTSIPIRYPLHQAAIANARSPITSITRVRFVTQASRRSQSPAPTELHLQHLALRWRKIARQLDRRAAAQQRPRRPPSSVAMTLAMARGSTPRQSKVRP